MLNYLEQLLEKKTQGKKDEILYTQWKLAKNHVPQVLANIANIFPHYTLHDRTHSEAILTNITRILGQKIFEEHFSSIDLWLLLCAAFYHDMGMAPFAPDLDKILKDEEFFLYFREIKDNPKHILHNQASYFEVAGKKISWKNNEISLERIEAFKFILAEYIRRNHGERTENTLKNDPSLYLPSNPIPQRLINLLGKICECHTKSFEKVMELPFEEAGLEYEPCHPRFIACLLRLGDLLDLDNNRVSEIVLRTIKTIPAESFFHIQKHLSISHLNINSKQIDITAECEEYKTADLASSWFSWLDKEITDQMKNWNQIVPNQEFGFLPTVGNLKVELKGYDSIDGKVHPKFEIDTQKAIEMLQGANLYSEPFQSIREILQNAVDATYLRIWVENKDSNSNMTLDEFIKECGKDEYAIRVKIEKNEEFSDDEKIVWHITIADAGIGMSKEDLKFLYKTGSSSQNKEKQKYLSEMPEWMKPSGTFGIGFQSIFLITDKVHIRTRKYNSGDEYDLDLYNPTGEDNGTILLKTIKNSNFKVGTEISFDLVDHISDYDFIESESLDLVNYKLVNAIQEFAEASYQKIKLNGKEEQIKKIEFPYYSKRTNLAISINFYNHIMNAPYHCKVFYRNQPTNNKDLEFYFLEININILGSNAKNILTLNRNEINNKYYDKLYRDTIITVIEYLKENFSIMPNNQKILASAFTYLYADTAGIKYDDSEIFIEWKKYPIIIIDKNQQIQQIPIENLMKNFNSIEFFCGEYKKIRLYNDMFKKYKVGFNDDIFEQIDDKKLRIYRHNWAYFGPNTVLLYKLISQQNFNYNRVKNHIHIIKLENNLLLKNEYLSWLFVHTRIIPCKLKYIKLSIKANYTYSSRGIFYNLTFFPKMINPYIVKRSENGAKLLQKDMSERLINFVYNHRRDETVTKDEIRDTYKQFIKDSESAINEINEESTPSKKTE